MMFNVGGAVDRYADWGKEHVPAVDVFQAGMVGVVRYLSLNPAKNLTAVERDDLLAHGLDILLVWETTETRSLEGTAAGVVDGVLAAQQAQALGYPKGSSILATTDTDTTWASVAPYHIAFDVAVAHYGYVGDIYAGYFVVRAGIDTRGYKSAMQTLAWSTDYSASPRRILVDPRAALYQNDFHFPIAGVDCDTSDVQHPVNGWRANQPKPSPKPKPIPKPVPKHAKGGPVSLTPQDLKDIAALIKQAQDTTILHIRPQVIAEIDAQVAALKLQLAAKGTI